MRSQAMARSANAFEFSKKNIFDGNESARGILQHIATVKLHAKQAWLLDADANSVQIATHDGIAAAAALKQLICAAKWDLPQAVDEFGICPINAITKKALVFQMDANDPTSMEYAIGWLTTNQNFLMSLFGGLRPEKCCASNTTETDEVPPIEAANDEQQQCIETITALFEAKLLKRRKAHAPDGISNCKEVAPDGKQANKYTCIRPCIGPCIRPCIR